MSAQRIESFVTPERYLALEHAASFKSEYISGEMIAMAGASEAHEIIAINLAREISTALRGAPCRPLGNNMKVRVRQANYLYPDLTVTCGERQYADNERPEVLLNPTAVFEISAPNVIFTSRFLRYSTTY
jgi:Uma2 family endonuclease